jgi:Ca-activated chloride channel family protein
VTFAHPLLAALCAIVFPAAFFAQRLSSAFHSRRAVAYSNLAFMIDALDAPQWPHVVLDLAFAAAYALMLAASAGPRVWMAAPASPTIVICLDTSGSMNEHDVRPSRSIAAADAVRSFVNAAPPGARIGLVSFSGTAQREVTPARGNMTAVLTGLTRVPAPNGQTAIGDALALAETMLPDNGMRAIVLITDGANNRGEDPRAVVRQLAAAHIRLDTIAIGNAPAVRVLRSFAVQTGGIFARTGTAATITAQMLQLAAIEFTARTPVDCTAAFVIAALCLGAAAWLASAGPAHP